MKKRILMCIPVMILGLAAWPTHLSLSQETSKTTVDAKETLAEEQQFLADAHAVYRLDFVVREQEGDKTINSRAYSMSVMRGDWGKIRVGSKVPIKYSDTQTNYQDVGINIDCRLQWAKDNLLLTTNFESSSYVPEAEARSASAPKVATTSTANPIIRHVSLNGDALLTIGKPAVIAKLDDVGTNRRYEIEVTATKVK